MTEEEARKKTCPFIAIVAMQTMQAALMAAAATAGQSIEELDEAVEKIDPYCMASDCIMWDVDDCGLKR